MKQSTINKIIENSMHGKRTKIGKYVYEFRPWTKWIYRCKPGDEDRFFINWDGEKEDYWEIIITVG